MKSLREDGGEAPGINGEPRIAILLNKLSGGGAEKVVVHLANWMAARGVEVHLLLCSGGGAYANAIDPTVRVAIMSTDRRWRITLALLRRGGFYTRAREVFRFRSHPKPVRAVRSVVRHLRKHDIGTLMSTLEAESVANVVAKRWLGGSLRSVLIQVCVYTIYREQERQANRGREPYKLHFLEKLARRADRVIAVSQGVADDLVKAGLAPAERVAVIPNPLVRSAASNAPDPALPSARFILAAGRLSPEKGFDQLIRAFANLEAGDERELVIAGEGPQRGELARLAAEFGVSDRVRLCGFRTDLPALMRRADCFVLTSRYEGFGNVLLEALAEGCPVVSTDCPCGPAEILDQGRFGTLVPVGDVGALSRAIAATLREPVDRSFLRWRAQAFSMDAIGERYLDTVLPVREPDSLDRSPGASLGAR